jgi:hypothetical protein
VLLVAIPKNFSARLNIVHCFWSQFQNFLWAAERNAGQPRGETFGIYQQKQLKLTVFCSAAQRNFLEIVTKTTQIGFILFYRAAKIWKLPTKQFNLHVIVFLLPGSEKFWNLRTKATQINCILFSGTAKFLRIYQQKHSLSLVLTRSEKNWFANKRHSN